ncbi:hypothetical protein DPEC_G00255670 [Dallia pectoralis]|uniref:Uncharacterized protein n=1 Tax=Dallia pectoralis TaxID=75939 RepID=A0ACC2FUX5_DALPE|nr:hypothetical protein DPEC_G00255670 [Dallia pectoralis]
MEMVPAEQREGAQRREKQGQGTTCGLHLANMTMVLRTDSSAYERLASLFFQLNKGPMVIIIPGRKAWYTVLLFSVREFSNAGSFANGPEGHRVRAKTYAGQTRAKLSDVVRKVTVSSPTLKAFLQPLLNPL